MPSASSTVLRRRSLLAVSLAAGLVLAPVAQQDPTAGLDDFIVESMAIWNTPGVAVAVVKDDELVYAKGFGVRQVGKDAPVDADTIFPIASNTKALTAATVAIVVDEGKLAWDERVTKYFPNFTRGNWLPDITLRNLLSFNTTGRFQYLGSGSGYDVATDMLTEVTGIGWLEFMETRLLQPLGMTYRTGEELWNPEDVRPCDECPLEGRSADIDEALVDNITMLHVYDDGAPRAIGWLGGRERDMVGGFKATARELSRWMRLLLAGGTFDGMRIMGSDVVDAMLSRQVEAERPAYPEAGDRAERWGYGFGWHVADYLGRRIAIHGGTLVGARSMIALMPDENLGVAVLVNRHVGPTGLGNALPQIVAFQVFDTYLGAPFVDRNAARATAERGLWRLTFLDDLEDRRIKNTTPSLPLEAYVGTYRSDDVSGRGPEVMEIDLENGQLTYRSRVEGAGMMRHWHLDVFSQHGRGPNRYNGGFFSFVIGAAGEVDAVRFSTELMPGGGWVTEYDRVKQEEASSASLTSAPTTTATQD